MSTEPKTLPVTRRLRHRGEDGVAHVLEQFVLYTGVHPGEDEVREEEAWARSG